jgi:NAD(P)-dependent dehydrogenase (short-subunit alcohol dehydrogenase family)
MAALRDRHVVVLGGTSGIGYATALACGQAGARVTVASRDSARVAAAVRTLSATSASRDVDATDRAALEAFFDGVGVLDHLVLSMASGGGAGPFRELDLASLRRAIEGKFWAYVNAVQAALPHLSRQGSSVVMVTAASARAATPATAGLAASNGALNAMVPTLALELAPVRVNAVCPGIVTTPIFERWSDERREQFTRRAEATPAGRPGRPDEVAGMVVALLENEYVTGTIVDVDGGIHLRP